MGSALMENLRKLELMVAAWYKDAPHLPENARKWIAENIWWITLIGVVLGAVGVFGALTALLAGAAIIGLGGHMDAVIGGALLWAFFITLVFAGSNVILAAVAVSPLKSMRRLGWSLLFVASLINVVSLVASCLFNYSLFNLVFGVLFAGVGLYFLFEIRDFYHEAPSTKRRTAPKIHKA